MKPKIHRNPVSGQFARTIYPPMFPPTRHVQEGYSGVATKSYRTYDGPFGWLRTWLSARSAKWDEPRKHVR